MNQQWSRGIGYYLAHNDVGTDLYIDYLPSGKHVIRYSLKVSQNGTFTSGYAKVESMYAPEFSAHTEGGKVVTGQHN